MPRRPTAALLVPALVAACSVLPSGQRFTFAKVDADQSLVPARSAPTGDEPEHGSDSRLRIGDHVNLTLKGGFLRYLEAVDRPEVLVFVRVKVRPFDTNQEPLVWEQIHLHSEDVDEQTVLAKDSFLPKFDIPILPSFEYGGEQIEVSLRIVELDQDDNERWRSLVNVATATTAALRPESATIGSAFQAALTFLTANNPDDIEFQFDFGLHPGATRHTLREVTVERGFDIVLQPRVGTYVVVKTEHQDRANLPSNWFDLTHHGLRYGVAQVLKLGTLGFFNWPLWTDLGADRLDDFYLKIMGRPFAIERESWALPEFVDGKLSLPRFGGRLHWDGDRLVHRIRGQPETFRAQSYLVLGIDRAAHGLDLISLRQAAAAQQRIGDLVKTGQLRGADFDATLQKLGSEIRVAALGERVTSRLQPELDGAEGPAQVDAALRHARLAIDQMLATGRLTTTEADSLRRQAEARAEVARARLGDVPDAAGVSIHPTIALAPRAADGAKPSFAMMHPLGTTLGDVHVRLPDGSMAKGETGNVLEVGGRQQSNVAFVLPKVPTGPSPIDVTWQIGGGAGTRRLWLLPAVAITGVELVLDGKAPEPLAGDWQPGQTVQFTYAQKDAIATIPGIGAPIRHLLPGSGSSRVVPVAIDRGQLRATNVTGKAIPLLDLLRSNSLASEPAALEWQEGTK